jgi:hypothetical protein
MHFFLSMLIIVQLVFYFGNKFLTDKVDFPEVPKPQTWQYIWLSSLVPAFIGYLSLGKNNLKLMRIYYKGTIFLGLGTVLATMLFNASDLWDYAQTKKTSNLYHDFPIIVLWYMYLLVVVQIHVFGIYFARILIRAWSKDQKKKKN